MDRWAKWLLETRFGGDRTQVERTLEFVRPIRDRVVANARIGPGDVVLDVGTGDGLIAFSALELVGGDGRVIFSDVSEDLLGVCRGLAAGRSNVEFVQAAADDLAPIADESVDVVTTRSVLIYVTDKVRAFREFFRVLRPGGRLSIFEPINRWEYENRPATGFWGFEAAAIEDLVAKVMAAYRAGRPPIEGSPMFDFDERDLIRLVRAAGFETFNLDYTAAIERKPLTGGPSTWQAFLGCAGNPNDPTIGEVLEAALTPDERQRFEEHLRPQVERGEGTSRAAVAYLSATKESAAAPAP